MPLRHLSVLLLAAIFVAARAEPGASRPIPTGYVIDATYDPERMVLVARANVGLRPSGPSPTVRFELHSELQVTRVRLGGRDLPCQQETVFYPLNYSMTANQVTCGTEGLDLSSGLEIAYEGMFNRSVNRGMSEYYRGDSSGLYLRGWPAVLWMPIFLQNGMDFPKAPPVHAILRAPKDFTSIMAGEHLGHRIEGGQAVDEWRAQGLTYYQLQYSTAAFARLDAAGVSVFSLTDPESLAGARKIVGLASELVRRYSQLYRTKPVANDRIYVVELPKFGDIASGNVFGMQVEEWRRFDVNAFGAQILSHELVHPYVQMATPNDDPMIALSIEGAPAYFDRPVLASIRGGQAYDDQMDRIQKRYLERRQPGAKDSEGLLPPEKPIFAMTRQDIGIYKDRFVLADRALLFWDYMRRRMGTAAFDAWVKEITNARRMGAVDFYNSIKRHAPALLKDAHIWLESKDYPDHFRRPSVAA